MGGPARQNLTSVTWNIGQVAIGIKRAGALLDGSITEQEKLRVSSKMPQPRRARQKVAILLISGGLVRSSDDID